MKGTLPHCIPKAPQRGAQTRLPMTRQRSSWSSTGKQLAQSAYATEVGSLCTPPPPLDSGAPGGDSVSDEMAEDKEGKEDEEDGEEDEESEGIDDALLS